MTKMTAKLAATILRGERTRLKSEFALLELQETRLARAGRASTQDAANMVKAAHKRLDEAYKYALASLALSKKSGKSALKEVERQGLTVKGVTDSTLATLGSPPAPTPPAYGRTHEDVDPDEPDEEDDEYEEEDSPSF